MLSLMSYLINPVQLSWQVELYPPICKMSWMPNLLSNFKTTTLSKSIKFLLGFWALTMSARPSNSTMRINKAAETLIFNWVSLSSDSCPRSMEGSSFSSHPIKTWTNAHSHGLSWKESRYSRKREKTPRCCKFRSSTKELLMSKAKRYLCARLVESFARASTSKTI